MKNKNIALLLTAALTFAALPVSGKAVTIGSGPEDAGVAGDDYVEEYNPDDEEYTAAQDSGAETAPQTEAPQTEAPQPAAPQSEAPAQEQWQNQWTEGSYTPQPEDGSGYDDGYGDGAPGEERLYDGYEGNAADLGPDQVIDDFELFGLEEAKRDFDLPEVSSLPAMFYLQIPELLQKPELPTGCETTALTMVLQYEGFDVTKREIAVEYLFYNREDDNLALGFVGDPFSSAGAGWFAPAVTVTADYYFQENEADYRAYDISDTEMEDLLTYLAAGTPVMVWTTMYMEEPQFGEEIGEYNDRLYRWYGNEHCVVLSGFNREEGTIQVNDPLDGIVERDMEEFTRIYEETGRNAVVIKAQGDADKTAPKAAAQTETAQTETAPAEASTGLVGIG